jgi:hypothetical protein
MLFLSNQETVSDVGAYLTYALLYGMKHYPSQKYW